MQKQQKTSYDTATRKKLLSDFIYDLNIIRRQLSLHSEDHLQTTNSCEIVLTLLKKLCHPRAKITLTVTPETLIFNQVPLQETNLAQRDCARFYSALDIASISFHKDLDTEELIRFNQIVTRDKEVMESEGGLKVLLQTHKIQHISVILVDDSNLQMGELTWVPDKQKPGELRQIILQELLQLEDNHEKHVPQNNQRALSQILTGMIKTDVEPKTVKRLKANLEKQSVERHCCTILFNMLNNRVSVETEKQIQDNLVELSRFFFDTGDFISLQEIYLRWSEHLYSGTINARFLDEKVLSNQTQESFMNEVLDNVQLWGQEKYDDICRYICEVGEAYAELLIHRLGVDEQTAQRTTWMKLLVELGSKGHQIIVKALEDKRWFLVRNLLIVLSRQKNIIPIKAVHQLTEHPHPKVRQEALKILFRYNAVTANRLLLKELSSGDRESLAAAIPLAENSQDSKVLHQLHQLIQAEINSDSDLQLSRQLLETLAFLGKPQSIPVLAKLLKKKGFLRSRRQKDFHRDIVNHLGSFPSQVSEPLLNSIINGHDRTLKQLARIQLQSYQHLEGRA